MPSWNTWRLADEKTSLTRGMMQLEGAEDLFRQFREMDRKTARRELRKVAKKAGQVFLDAVRNEAPRSTGELRKQTLMNVKILSRSGHVSALTRVDRGYGDQGQRPIHYQHLVVGGTDPHFQPGPMVLGGRVLTDQEHPGAKANPYVDRAFDRNAAKVLAVVIKEMRNRLDAIARRAARKRKRAA